MPLQALVDPSLDQERRCRDWIVSAKQVINRLDPLPGSPRFSVRRHKLSNVGIPVRQVWATVVVPTFRPRKGLAILRVLSIFPAKKSQQTFNIPAGGMPGPSGAVSLGGAAAARAWLPPRDMPTRCRP